MAFTSSFRVVVRVSYSASALAQRSFRSFRNCVSLAWAAVVSLRFCFAAAFCSSASARSWVCESTIAFADASSFVFAAFRSANCAAASASSFCDCARFVSNVSFICSRMPKMAPLAEL